MVRRSARVKALDTAPVYTDPPAPGKGTKRKSDATGTSPSAKRGRKSSKKDEEKEQKTVDDTMDVDNDQNGDEGSDAENEQDAADAGAQPQANDAAPPEKPDEDVKMSEEPKAEPKADTDGSVKQPDKAEPAQNQRAEAESVKEPEQLNQQGEANQTSAPPTKEPEQPKIDDYMQQEAEEPVKPKDDTPQASGALQPESDTGTSRAVTSDSKPDHGQHDHPAPPAPQAEVSQPEKDDDQPRQPTPQALPPQTEQKDILPEQPTARAEPPQAEKNDTKVEQQPPPPERKEEQPSVADYQQPNGRQSEDKVADKTTEDKSEPSAHQATNGDAVQANARDDDVPSSILEKGIVYFFFRARVNINDPQDVNDIARSYMILRPLPRGAQLGYGPVGDDGNCRLIAIPKKVLPLSAKDRFMAFVESARKPFSHLRSSFLAASDYATKTQGTSHTPPATPIAEGVYAITTTGRESHFAYMTTIPNTLGEVQKDVGIKEQGSFVVSAKNPKYPGPANASLQKQPEYPQSMLDDFRDLRWMPLKPELLDYENTQFLLIGESRGVDAALEQLPRDEKKGFDEPKEEMERLEAEDELRVKHLKGDDAVFTDLGISKTQYPALMTTWES